jgi:hypothetical protein
VTKRYHFLELATRAYSLQDESFSGAWTFVRDDASVVRRWLAARIRRPGAGARADGVPNTVIG